MKRMGVCVLMLLGLLFTAHAAPGDLDILNIPYQSSKDISAMVADGDTLYLLMKDAVYTLRAGETAPQPFITGLTERVTALFVQDDTLYGLTYAWTFLPLQGEGAALALEIPYPEDPPDIVSAVLTENALYALLRPNGQDPALYSFDLSSGKYTAYQTPDIQEIAPYQDGKLLLLRYTNGSQWDHINQAFYPGYIAVWDPDLDTAENKVTLTGEEVYFSSGLAYDAATDCTYIAQPGQVLRIKGFGAPELCARHPAMHLFGFFPNRAALFGGQYALLNYQALYVRGTDPKLLSNRSLVIDKAFSNDSDMLACAQMDGVPVTFAGGRYMDDTLALQEALLTRAEDVDIYCIRLDRTDLHTLMAKQYCVDMAGNAAIDAYIGQLFPALKDAVSQSGAIYALPYDVETTVFGAYPARLAEIGLQVPTTFEELCNFISVWFGNDYEDVYSQYTPFGTNARRRRLIYLARDLYVQHIQATGQPLTLDTPLFRRLMEAADAAETGSGFEIRDLLFQDAILSPRFSDEESLSFSSSALPLRITADIPPTVAMTVSVYVINPYSKNRDLALQYLEQYCKNISEITWISLSFEHTAPLERASYAAKAAELQSNLDTLNAQLQASTAGLTQDDLRAQVEAAEQQLSNYNKNLRYTASPESIAAYHALMRDAIVLRPSPLSGTEFDQLLRRLDDKQITVDQLITEGEQKLRMMQLENQ